MKKLISIIFTLTLLATACSKTEQKTNDQSLEMKKESKKEVVKLTGDEEVATLAGGCFWCMQAPFEKVQGVVKVVAGYAGGIVPNPTYEEVSSGKTKYRESIQVYFDPQVISFSEILEVYWRQFDPTDAGGSFQDRGHQYTSAIFYHNEKQKEKAEQSEKELSKSGIFNKPIVTPIIKYSTFYPAEEYHQDYYKKNPERYHSYREGSGRDEFIMKTWGEEKNYTKPSNEELKKKLTDLQYKVTQKE
ncbi:MAG: peptide-methionine (S)-S-oxide reductase MsrA, partial [Ignavibacteriaceae bacterium]|nr:peptide-methionine (S)-S-oxide reductase MsrA [Ignavibacteriaceae bacterium]